MVCPAAQGADAPAEEDQLIAVLRSDRPPQDKDAACRRLKLIGTARCVPALAPLLADGTLWESALLAIQNVPGDQASAALREALAAVRGANKAGIISCIGFRRDAQATGSVAQALGDDDPAVAASAARALGAIGGPEAIAALRSAAGKGAPEVQAAVADALVRCAEMLLAGGDARSAADICRGVYDSGAPTHIRTAAYRGLIFAAGEQAPALAVAALREGDRAAALASLRAVVELPGHKATVAFASALAGLPPTLQPAVIDLLAQRGDPAAAPAVGPLIASSDPTVAAAAIRASGELNNTSAVPALLRIAAADGPHRDAAAAALVRLRGQAARSALLDELAGAAGRPRRVLLDVLARRQEPAAAQAVLNAARSADDAESRLAAISALGAVGDGSVIPGAVDMLLKAASAEQRTAVENAIASIIARNEDKAKCAAMLVSAIPRADSAGRCALLRLCGPIGGDAALGALREGMRDADPAVQDAALRALAECPDGRALADLLAIVEKPADVTRRVLAMRGALRLVDSPAVPLDARLAAIRTCMAAAREEDRRLVLSAAGRVAAPQAVALVEPYLSEPAAKNEAAAAMLQIAAAIQTSHPQEALAALKRIAAASPDPRTAAEAAKLMRKLEADQRR